MRRRALAAALAFSVAILPQAAGASALLIELAGEAGSAAGLSTRIETFADWQVTCRQESAGRTCRAETRGSATADGATIGLVLAGDPAGDGRPIFHFTTPLDLLVANGIEMRVDGGPAMRLAYRSCHQGGCIVPFTLTPDLEGLLQRGSSLDVRLFDIHSRPIDIRLSLIGFTAAIREMRQR